MTQPLRHLLDHSDDLVAPITLTPCEVDELAHLDPHCALLRRTRYPHATTTSEINETFVPKDVEGPKHRVSIDAEHGGEVDCSRESFTRRRLALGDRASDLGGYLVMEGSPLITVNSGDSGDSHGPMDRSTICP